MLKIIPHFFLFIIILVWFGHVPALAQERFTENGNGTVTDRESGLMWSQTDNKADIFWKEAHGLDKKPFCQIHQPAV